MRFGSPQQLVIEIRRRRFVLADERHQPLQYGKPVVPIETQQPRNQQFGIGNKPSCNVRDRLSQQERKQIGVTLEILRNVAALAHRVSQALDPPVQTVLKGEFQDKDFEIVQVQGIAEHCGPKFHG
jgi:hypothetical protein